MKATAPAVSLPLPPPPPLTLSPRRSCRCLAITAALVTSRRSAQTATGDTECRPVVMTALAHSRRRRCCRCRHRCCHHHCRTAAATAATINTNQHRHRLHRTYCFAHTAHALLFVARSDCAAMVLSHSTACDMTSALRCALPPLPHPPRQGYSLYYYSIMLLLMHWRQSRETAITQA